MGSRNNKEELIMKTIAILLVVAIAFAAIVVAALYGVLGHLNEETRKRCGNCLKRLVSNWLIFSSPSALSLK